MRSRTILSAVLGAVIAGLVAVIVFLGGYAGPDANAEATPPETPGQAATAPHDKPARHSGRGNTSRPKTVPTKTARTKTARTKTARTKTAPTKTSPEPPRPPRLGTASVPPGATYDASRDGQAFTAVFSTLEASTDGTLSKRLSTTIKLTGDTRDAVLELYASGYALTDASTTARLTVAANGRSVRRGFRQDWDDDFVQTLTVPLRGAHECTMTLTVEVQPDPRPRAGRRPGCRPERPRRNGTGIPCRSAACRMPAGTRHPARRRGRALLHTGAAGGVPLAGRGAWLEPREVRTMAGQRTHTQPAARRHGLAAALTCGGDQCREPPGGYDPRLSAGTRHQKEIRDEQGHDRRLDVDRRVHRRPR
jgi:hypothetical protein